MRELLHFEVLEKSQVVELLGAWWRRQGLDPMQEAGNLTCDTVAEAIHQMLAWQHDLYGWTQCEIHREGNEWRAAIYRPETDAFYVRGPDAAN